MSFTDRYDLQVPLGRSPAGIVWQATRKKDDRTVAVAIADGEGLMDETLFGRVRERFRKDLSALTKAKKGHLPQVHEVDEDDAANPYAAMELVPGESLASLMDDDLDLETIGKVVDGVLRALESSHRVRVFHGDIEPGNVLYDEASGAVNLVGFGLNRALASAEGWGEDVEETLTRSAVHRAPELDRGELPSDARADLYAVGALLHQILAGQPPKKGRSIGDVAPELGASMVKVVDRALDPSAQGRFASAWAMRTALNAAVRMVARGEKPPSRTGGKKTIPGGMKAPDVPAVPKVPASVPPPPASSRPSAPPPPPKSSRPSAPPPPSKVKPSTPPPPPKSSPAPKPKTAPPPPPEPKSKGPATVPIAVAPPPDNDDHAPLTGAGSPSSIPPPVVGVGVGVREETQSVGLEDLTPAEVPEEATPAARTSVPPPVPAEATASDDDELDLPLAASPSFFRSPIGLAAVAVIAIGVGLAIGRATAPEPTADVGQVAAAPAAETEEPEAEPEVEEPAEAPEAEEPVAEAEPEAEPAEALPGPEPLRIGSLPDGVSATVAGAPYDADSPPTLTPDGPSVPLVIQRDEQRVRLSLARDAEGNLDVSVAEFSEPPEPEAPPVVAASPMARSRSTRRRRSSTTMMTSSGGSLMRPGIAYDPGF
ncbi:MAG: serine/threonine protein kinase [Deltaproteobacteria bacterium]|nr:serine/threonine protein kinase [Deltaproteobacteria bacterium]